MSVNNANIKAGVILFLIVLVLLYLLTFGKADLLAEDREERKRKLEEKKKFLDERYDRVQKVLGKKKELKMRLETVSKRVLFGVRLTLGILFVSTLTIIYFYSTVTFLELSEYVGALALIVLLIGFVWIGSPANFFTIWTYFEKKLRLKIYGKYIDIDSHIDAHEKELQRILTDKSVVEKELKEIPQVHVHFSEIMGEEN